MSERGQQVKPRRMPREKKTGDLMTDETVLRDAVQLKQSIIRDQAVEGFKREGRGVVTFKHPGGTSEDFWQIGVTYQAANSLKCGDDQRARVASFLERYNPESEMVAAAILPDGRWIVGQFEI